MADKLEQKPNPKEGIGADVPFTLDQHASQPIDIADDPTKPRMEPGVSVTEPSQHASNMQDLLKKLDLDPYNEDEAELRFLHSKPTCFIILGKPGSGKTSLAHKLAAEWRCEVVNPTDLLSRHIDLQTEQGKTCLEMLLRGEAVPEEVLIKMVEEKVNSPEVAHHGYVLDGFPSLCEDYMSIKDQLDLVKNWKLKPDFIINIKVPDKDLEVRRVDQKIDPSTGEIYTKAVYAPDKPAQVEKPEGDEEEEMEEEDEDLEEMAEEEEESTPEVPPEVLERLITRPDDLPSQVADSIRNYKNNILRIYEDYMADHNQQYLIELDGNQNVNLLFKQLMSRLSCFVLRPAAVPVRLAEGEDEEVPPEEIDTDELMRMMGPRRMVAPRFRWRRSRWLRNCPVALYEGNVIAGKPEFAVSFLDKMFCMSSPEALDKFLKNPRPYMLPPQPRPPCKISILGPPLSGKTTLCHLLAQKYGAKVLDIDELMKTRIEEEKVKLLAQVRQESTEMAIVTIKTRIKEQMDAEAAAREALNSELETEDQSEEGEKEEGEEGEEEAPQDTTVTETEKDTDQTTTESEAEKKEERETSQEGGEGESAASAEGSAPEPAEEKPPPAIEVDAEHPEVVAIVEAAVAEAEKQAIVLSPEVLLEILEAAVQQCEAEMRQGKKDGPMYGGWILDNYPRTRDQWNALIEKGFLPDEVVCLRDNSEAGNFLTKRWYLQNREKVDEKIKVRLEAEEKERIRLAEEKKRKEEEDRKAAEDASRIAAEEEKQRRLDAGDDLSEDEDADRDDEDDDVDTDKEKALEEPTPTQDDSKEEVKEDEEEDACPPGEEKVTIPDGPEVDVFREKRREFERDFPAVQSTITGSTSIDTITIEVEGKKEEDMMEESVTSVERQLTYQGWEYSGVDLDEEDEDGEADQEGDEEEEVADEDEDPNRSRKKPLGDTNHFCPVALKETHVLYPGNPEISAKYREKTYYMSTVEAREKFLLNPEEYLPKTRPLTSPPVRLLILGPRGAGKSVHGRQLAKKLGIFHIAFKERLQELVIAKTKRKIGPEYDDDQEEPVEPEEEEEDEEEKAAMIGPDGTPFDEREKSTEDINLKTEVSNLSEEKSEEEEEIEFTEEEEAIKANLESDEPLPAEVLDNIIPHWWHKEPFKSTGFLLEGFPRTADEARYLAEMGLFPDAALILTVEDTDVIARLLPPKLDKWRIKRNKREAKKQKKKEKAQKKRDAAMQKRRDELTKEREEKLAEKKARQADRDSEMGSEEEEEEEDEEEEEEEDIEAILAEEFEEEELEEEEEEELEEDATDRLKNDLEEVYDLETNRLATVQEALEELLVSRLDIDGGKKPHIVRYTITKRLKPFTEFRHSMFERVYPVSERLAKKMLQCGYKQPSRFGRWCPVRLHEGDCIQPMSGPGYPTYPCLYRQHIYFLSSPQAREQFMLDPMTYLKHPSPKPVVPIRMAIIGPPKSGKTALAMRFAEEYGLLRLSIGEAMRTVLNNQPKTELARLMNNHLKKGLTVPDELSIQALEVCLMDIRSQTRGYILDGYPQTKRQVELMTERSIIPVRVVELTVDSMEVMVRGTHDRTSQARVYPVHDSSKILAMKLQCYKNQVGEVQDWYKKEHMNIRQLDAERSKWWVWNSALDLAKESVTQIQHYLQRIQDGKSGSIADMCVTPTEFLVRVGDFGQYCPVSMAIKGELVDCSVNNTLTYAAEFRGHYYKMAGKEELEEFLAEPEKYVPPMAPHQLPSPELLPRRVRTEDLHDDQTIQLQGYCAVTFLDGKCRYEAIVPGSSDNIVEYREKFYYLESEEKLATFLRSPEKYWNLRLPHKLPPKKESLPVTNLPMLGFMEQTSATLLTKALTAVGCFKPKYPFLSASRSALLYVAYYLKAYNPKSSDYVRKKYRQKLTRFEETCELIKYLGDTMTLRYREPTERPQDFDTKLETFFALKGIEPTPTWIA